MQVPGDIVWKEITQQFIPGIDTETEQTDKEKYAIIYQAAQVRFTSIIYFHVFTAVKMFLFLALNSS